AAHERSRRRAPYGRAEHGEISIVHEPRAGAHVGAELATFHEVLELALLPQVEEAFGEDEPPLADLELHTAAFDLRASVDPQSPSDRPLPCLLDEESCAHERAGALDIDDLAGKDGARRIEESGEIVRCAFAAGILGGDARRKA